MNTDVQRQKYLKMMTEIEDLEDKIEELEKKKADAGKLTALKEELAARRNELARVSDGCGKPHAH